MNLETPEPMDNSLRQLERELFSLTPVDPDRRLTACLERAVCAPAQIPRRAPAAASGTTLPFKWKRVVAPAAAAVAVVAVLSGTEGSSSAGKSRAGDFAAGGGEAEG